ncbi:MAG: hypothetical protein Q8M09_17165 [Pseudomonadota bacterium]|nr:hypothetical protein [Pseudomonadota bacterium]MDP1905948.1 hypothetical protein [Pseudomonadota bacterium]MDP2353831.1 hypothetical protein [Pseudomonadota bacterium]
MKPKNISKQLYDAIESGYEDRNVKAKLNAGASPDYRHNGDSLLELAVHRNNATAIKHLVAAGARIGGNELCSAVGNITIFELFLKNGVDINAKSRDGSTVLHAAIKYSDELSKKAAAKWNKTLVKRIETLLSFGANPMISNKDGLLPLNFALLGGNETLIDFLLPITNARRKDYDHQNNDGQTLLMRSVLDNDLSRVKDLVACGASLSILDKDLHTALSLAIKHGYNDIALFMHKKGGEYKKSLKIDNEDKMLSAVRCGHLGNVYEAILRGEAPPAIAAIVIYK